MRGLLLEGVGQVSYRTDLPDPVIEADTDAVVAVRLAGLCGSDLHPYAGREPVRFGVVPGHEVIGEIVAVGTGVARFRCGEDVIVPFTSSCGACPECGRGLSSRCRHGSLFGYGPADQPAVPALGGGQAELLRVPLADGTLVRKPPGMADSDALLLADNLPTGWYAAERAGVGAGEVVAVVGLGAVGLCAVAAIQTMAAGRVVAVDPVADRRRRAELLGAIAVFPYQAAAVVADVTAPDHGAAAVIEAAGTPPAQALAAELLRPGGTLSTIAVPTDAHFAFPPGLAYDRNLSICAGRAPVRSILERLLPKVSDGRLAVPRSLVVTHPDVGLAHGPEIYRRFAAREPGMVKAAFRP